MDAVALSNGVHTLLQLGMFSGGPTTWENVEAYEFLRRVESNARTYASVVERVLVSGHGAWVQDSRGKTLVDCLACAGALPLGHNHPEVTEAVLRYVSSGQLQQALDLATPAKFEFVRELWATLPKEFADRAKIQFCSPSGSDAVEAAMKLTRFATQRRPILAFHGAYHGMTRGALGAMGNLVAKSGAVVGAADVHFVPYPNRLHCPFGSDGEDSARLTLNYLRTVLSDPESGIPKPAAILLEVIQGEGGCIPASIEWMRGIRALASECDVPLIIDEVQTGFARTGKMFAFQHAEVVPDVLVLSKALGGGYPLAAIVYDERLDLWPRGMHAGTFRGNQIAMVAGRTTMSIIRRDDLAGHAARMGELLVGGLRQLSRRYPMLADVRGQGLMVGVEVAREGRGSMPSPADGAWARALKLEALQNGLLLETGGRHGAVLRFLPPLILDASQVAVVLERMEAALRGVTRQRASEAHAP